MIASYKEMTRVIRFVLDIRDTCLKLKPNLDDEFGTWLSIVIVIGSEMSRIGSL
jgi:hypothetical protein